VTIRADANLSQPTCNRLELPPFPFLPEVAAQEETGMPHDAAQTGLGLEIASLRALGEGRRRRSLADRLLRESRTAEALPKGCVGQMRPKSPPFSQTHSEP